MKSHEKRIRDLDMKLVNWKKENKLKGPIFFRVILEYRRLWNKHFADELSTPVETKLVNLLNISEKSSYDYFSINKLNPMLMKVWEEGQSSLDYTKAKHISTLESSLQIKFCNTVKGYKLSSDDYCLCCRLLKNGFELRSLKEAFEFDCFDYYRKADELKNRMRYLTDNLKDYISYGRRMLLSHQLQDDFDNSFLDLKLLLDELCLPPDGSNIRFILDNPTTVPFEI